MQALGESNAIDTQAMTLRKGSCTTIRLLAESMTMAI